MPIFRGRQLIGYDFDSECELIDQMIENGALVYDEKRHCYVMSEQKDDKDHKSN